MIFHKVIELIKLADNRACVADLNGYEILVGVTNKGYFAVENNCPHQNKPLCGGRIRHGHISCPIHGMRFNLETGAPAGQLTNKSIKVYEARANGDWLEVGELDN